MPSGRRSPRRRRSWSPNCYESGTLGPGLPSTLSLTRNAANRSAAVHAPRPRKLFDLKDCFRFRRRLIVGNNIQENLACTGEILSLVGIVICLNTGSLAASLLLPEQGVDDRERPRGIFQHR